MGERFDVAVVGGGMGGYVAAIRAAQLGLKVALIEEDKVGGTCLHRGCIPTKVLLQTAALLDELGRSDTLGVTTEGVGLDYATVGRRRAEIVGQLHRGVIHLLKKNRVTTIAGRGRIAGSGRVAVHGAGEREGQEQELESQEVIIATGSRPRALPGVAVDGRHILTSDEAVTLDHVPRSAVVIGAGAVGVEFASFYRSCGAEVTLVEMAERLVPLEDHEVSRELRRGFEGRGIRCLTKATVDTGSISLNEGGVELSVSAEDREERLQSEVLLLAAGRAANVDGAGLESAGVSLENGFVTVDGMLSTAAPGVKAIGDLVGGFLLAHKAMYEGVIAAEAIAGREPQPLDPRRITRTTYCSPEIASMGLSEEQARDTGHEVAVGRMPFRANGRALIWGHPGGMCKIVSDAKTKDVLGVHFIGHEVTELIYGPALGALLEATPFEISRAVAPHPTLTEVITEAAAAVGGDAIHI
ncbi:MAG TPA: dihydrolipoyl dehydrogenase [Candidatus Sulfotelmatobacter sp.]|nr:dihydrolipoyl dehydrogenase [Candidatus Sulfotelmatobacter sp.]